jgi:DNA adenine methylase
MTPLWRYMGGKRDLAPVVVEALGTGWDRYVEPCLGAGAVALALPPGPMVLADSDGPLVRLWQAVQQRPVRLAREAAELVGSGLTAERYRAIVEREVQGDAAALLVLLQACFNGVYRRGKFGLFNAPWNKKPTPALPSEADLVEAGRHIEYATVRQADALHTLHRCSHGDAVYVDPPYVGTQPYGGSFRWGWPDLRRLVEACEHAAHRGARVVLSHHDAPELRAMLRDRWEVRPVQTARPVNRDGGGRGKVSEVVVVFAV